MDEIKDLKAEKARLEKRVKHLEYLLDGAEHKAERRRKHIERIEEACHELRRRNRSLGDRLMPEDMGWPRFEDGEPVRIGDDFEDLGQVAGIKFGAGGVTIEGTAGNSDLFITSDERVQRPAVLAADGEPLKAGQAVYFTESGAEFVVTKLHDGKVNGHMAYSENDEYFSINPTEFTHQRPVLDADGVPIEEGDVVWLTGEPEYSWTVTHVSERHVGGYCNEDGSDLDMHSKSLTHKKPEPPDTWERIEEDARGLDIGVDRELFTHTHEDIVHRCKALADKGER